MEQAKRTLNLIIISFAVAGIIGAIVVTNVELPEPPNPDLADGAARAAGAFGAVGLLVALAWVARSGERAPNPNRLLMGFVVRVAVAELGLLMGLLGLFSTGSTTAVYVGLVFFLASLVLLAFGLRLIGESTS